MATVAFVDAVMLQEKMHFSRSAKQRSRLWLVAVSPRLGGHVLCESIASGSNKVRHTAGEQRRHTTESVSWRAVRSQELA